MSATTGVNDIMKKIIISTAIIASFILSGCGPEKSADERGRAGVKLIAVAPSSQQLMISWESYRQGLISGYDIFIAESSMKNGSTIEPYNTIPFPGDLDQSDAVEYFEASGLDNGKLYHVWVEIVFSDQTKSRPSRSVNVVCNPRGDIELPVRFKSDIDGFSFVTGQYTEAKAADNDVYYFNKENVDYIASAHRLDGFLRANEFAIISSVSSFEKATAKLISGKGLTWGDRIKIKTGDWISVRSADGSRTVLNVLGFSGAEDQRKVKLSYAFSTLVGGKYFF